MYHNIFVYNTRKNRIAIFQQVLLIAFIILSPVYKSFSSFTFLGLNPITIIIGCVLTSCVCNIIHIIRSRQKIFFSMTILILFCLELLMGKENSTGWVLAVLLYVCFLQTDNKVSVKSLYCAILISSIVAAGFSLSLGLIDGVMSRVAALVDGSIAPIAITVVLFFDTESNKKEIDLWDVLKIISLLCSCVVLVFGMSRARALVVGVLFAVFGILKLKNLINNRGKTSHKGRLEFIISIFFSLCFFLSLDKNGVFAPILNRFLNEGLSSMGRDVEMTFGLRLFKEHVWFGAGWGEFTFRDLNGSAVAYNNHCAYVAVLARGGLLLAVPVFLSYFALLKSAVRIRRSSSVSIMLMIVFLLLSYGNAGMFNYTICSIIPLVVLDIKGNNMKEV